jgi:hypothetical protein
MKLGFEAGKRKKDEMEPNTHEENIFLISLEISQSVEGMSGRDLCISSTSQHHPFRPNFLVIPVTSS